MIVLESLFILPFFLLVVTEDKQNGSVYSQLNNTVLHNATNVSLPHNDSESETLKELLVTEFRNPNSSVVNPQPNNSWVHNANTQDMNNSVSDSLEVTKFLHLVFGKFSPLYFRRILPNDQERGIKL